MGLEIGTIALIAGAVGAVGSTTAGIIAGNQQRAAQRHAQDLQTQAQEVQQADNAAKAAQERRQQIRDERIRQARVQQAAVNTGTEGSSGELGALGSITTQTQANVGFNLGAISRGNQITQLNQGAANAIAQGQQDAALTSNIGSIFSGISAGTNAFTRQTNRIKNPEGTYGSDDSFDNPDNYG